MISKYALIKRNFFKTNNLHVKDYYQILGINNKASDIDIKKAYFKLAKQYHPDLNPSALARERFSEVQEAYNILIDKTKKKYYDDLGLGEKEQELHTAKQDLERGYYSKEIPKEDIFMFDSLPEDIELNIKSYDKQFGVIPTTIKAIFNEIDNKRDIILEINLSFNEAIHGSQRVIYYDREVECQCCRGTRAHITKQCNTCKGCGVIYDAYICPSCDNGLAIEEECNQCGGSGKEEANKELIINIPKGVNNDTLLKVSNIGNYTKYGYSDVYIRLNVSIDSYFERKQDDIFTTNYIPLSIALLGGQVKVLGLYSSVEVNIPAGSVDNSIVKLKGLGVNKKGDHYVRIKVILPKSLNDEQRNIFEQIAKYEV